MLDLSIVIPSYQQPGKIEKCLKALLNQDSNLHFEIIVVDSSQITIQLKIEKICRQDQRIKLIKCSKQTNPGTARNIGIKASKADIIALVDSDCLAAKDWMDTVYEYIDDNLILVGIIENGTPDSLWGTGAFLVEFSELLAFKGLTKTISNPPTGCFSCKKNIFEYVGYFSDHRVLEDFLFCRTFAQRGGKCLMVNEIVLSHLNRTSHKKVIDSMFILGKHSAIARKMNGLGPKIIFKRPWLAFGLVFYRFFTIAARVYKTKYWLRFLLYKPIILYLLIYWSWGFYKGAKT